eukprot:scaffold7622_cov130-Isochrysis_galbana.AAC.4
MSPNVPVRSPLAQRRRLGRGEKGASAARTARSRAACAKASRKNLSCATYPPKVARGSEPSDSPTRNPFDRHLAVMPHLLIVP